MARNNRREWFQARKELYESRVRQPMLALVGEINHALAAFAPEYVTEPEKAVYRIYRDTRFSSDKTPYKRHVAAVFNRRGLAKNCGAGFYFSVSPTEIEIAGGVYMPGPEELFAIRSHITENYNEFRKRVTHIRLRRAMEDLKGESLSRSPKGFDPLHPAAAYVEDEAVVVLDDARPGTGLHRPTLSRDCDAVPIDGAGDRLFKHAARESPPPGCSGLACLRVE